MNSKSSQHNVEFSISEGNIRAQVAQLLYTLGYLKDSEEVTHMSFNTPNKDGTIPVTCKIKSTEQEVRVVSYQ